MEAERDDVSVIIGQCERDREKWLELELRGDRQGEARSFGVFLRACWAILLMTLRVSTELTHMRDLAEPLLYIKNLYK